MGVGVNILDIGELSAKIREYLQDVIDKGGNAIAEIECEEYRDVYAVTLVIREMHLELLRLKITPIVRLNTGMSPVDAIESALLMKSYAIATERLQKFHPKLTVADIRETINNEAIDLFKGKSRQEIAEELKKTFPEAKITFN